MGRSTYVPKNPAPSWFGSIGCETACKTYQIKGENSAEKLPF